MERMWCESKYKNGIDLPVRKSSKLSVINPSRSLSYFLNTSVIRFNEMQLCTKISKLISFVPHLSYARYNIKTNSGDRW